MKFCPKCGKEISGHDELCRNCGLDFTTILDSSPTESESRDTPGKTLEQGKILNKRYKIEKLIGKGGMGRVYKARDMQLEEDVALKMLERRSADKTTVERFLQEIKITRKVSHENICRIYDLVEADGKKFISMQYIDGEDLHTILKQKKRLEPDKAFRILEDILGALSVIHRNGIIHRDLKPANILIDRNGKAYLSDFGIAKSRESKNLTTDGTMIGTPHYMSPEQIQGKELDPRSDIYSLGVVMFHMFTGKTPFNADSAVSVAVKHLEEQPPRPTELNLSISKSLEKLILTCMKKKPYERPKDVEAILKELKSIQTQQRRLKKTSGDATMPDLPEIQSEKTGNPLLYIIPVVVVFLVAIIIIGILSTGDEENGIPNWDETEERLTGDEAFEGMVLVTGGEALTGTSLYPEDNSPPHTTYLDDYYMDMHEVTNEEYASFVEFTDHVVPPSWAAGNYPSGEDLFPVVGISRSDAQDYCKHIGKRLPTEEEWEWAARTEQGLFYPWGNDFNRSYAHLRGEYPVQIKSYERDKNPLGIYDLAGNVKEWTISQIEDEKGKTVYYIAKGGSFSATTNPENGRLTRKELIRIFDENVGYNFIGFRCVADIN